MKDEDFNKMLQSMNEKQKKLFYFVRNWCLLKTNDKRPNPFPHRIFRNWQIPCGLLYIWNGY
jgi:hypothetical protein